MLRILRLGLGGHRNRDGIRLIVIAGEEPPVVDLLQFHAVIIHDPIGRDRAAASRYERPGHGFAVQRFQFVHFGAATVQTHVVVPANSG